MLKKKERRTNTDESGLYGAPPRKMQLLRTDCQPLESYKDETCGSSASRVLTITSVSID